jgi:cytochrome c-type biogenesis protein
MMSAGVTYPLALIAGLSSFLSPCILPVVPFYLAFLAGDARERGVRVRVRRSLLFTAGMGLVFVFLGAGFGLFGAVTGPAQSIFAKIAGAVVVVFGFHFMGLIRLPFLTREYTIRTRPAHGAMSALRAFVLGAAFALGWTPCVGPILASILFLSSQAATLLKGMSLLAVYAAGLGAPFVVLAFGYERMTAQLDWLKRRMKLVSTVSGALLVLIGGLIVLGSFQNITAWIMSAGSRLAYLNEAGTSVFDVAASVALIAAGAGLAAWRIVARSRASRRFPWGGVGLGALLLLSGLGGVFGVLTPSSVLSAWLSFQGL